MSPEKQPQLFCHGITRLCVCAILCCVLYRTIKGHRYGTVAPLKSANPTRRNPQPARPEEIHQLSATPRWVYKPAGVPLLTNCVFLLREYTYVKSNPCVFTVPSSGYEEGTCICYFFHIYQQFLFWQLDQNPYQDESLDPNPH